MTFPASNCDICKMPFTDLNGMIAADSFARHVRALYARCDETDVVDSRAADGPLPVLQAACDRLLDGADGRFVDAVGKACFAQLAEHYSDPIESEPGHSLQGFAEQMLRDSSPHHRLQALLDRSIPKFDVYLLVHDDCMPDEIRDAIYPIDLSRIRSPAEAVEWTIHLSEKQSWNPHGWVTMLVSLFGRQGV